MYILYSPLLLMLLLGRDQPGTPQWRMSPHDDDIAGARWLVDRPSASSASSPPATEGEGELS